MYCKICGATLTPGDVFCKNCGASNTNEKIEPVAPNVEPFQPQQPQVQPQMTQPNMGGNGGFQPNVPPVEPEPVVPPVEPQVEESPTPENEPKGDGGKFLMVIGVVVGVLAVAVIAYLVYSSLKANENKNSNSNVTITNQVSYSVAFNEHMFSLPSNISAIVGESLNLSGNGWEAKVYYNNAVEFNKLTAENIKKVFEEKTEYKIGDLVQKNYSGVSCIEVPVDYTNGNKTTLLLCESSNGYWYMEVGSTPYTAYPTSASLNEVVKIVNDAKESKNSDSKLNIGSFNVTVEETELPENENAQ